VQLDIASHEFVPTENYILGKLVASKSQLVLLNTAQEIKFTPVLTVVSGTYNGVDYTSKKIVLNPGMVESFIVFGMSDGEFVYLPSFAVLGTVEQSKVALN
jgi:hypothetical protein